MDRPLTVPSVSIVIATRDRAGLLDECLTHVDRQRFDAGDEVIVVDNGSSDDTLTVIARHQRTCPVPLRAMIEPEAGKSRALTRALAAATGDVVAFTDDDVDVDGDWLTAIKRAMSDPEIALVGGPVDPRWERTVPGWLLRPERGYGRLAAPLALVDYGGERAPLGARTAVGANMAVRRDVLARVGGFALHLGKLRGTLLSGEDHDFCQRVQAAGFQAVYCPDIRVAHWVPAERTRIGYILRWFFWSGITHAAMDAGTVQERSIAGVPRYLFRRLGSGALMALLHACRGRMAAAVERGADAAFALGYMAGRWRVVTIAQPRVAHQV